VNQEWRVPRHRSALAVVGSASMCLRSEPLSRAIRNLACSASDTPGSSLHEHMVHQCVSEDIWFRTMLDIDVGAPPLPNDDIRLEFMRRYAEDSAKRLAAMRDQDETWWEEETTFFDIRRSRAWVMTRRIAHTAHNRGSS
jgi:lipase chaperone LimK